MSRSEQDRDDASQSRATSPGAGGAPASAERGMSGKPLVIAVLVLAVVLAVGAVVYYRYVSRQAGEYFGAEDGNLIVKAPKVELLRLGEAGEGSETIALAGRKFAVVQRLDVTKAKGLHNLRQALLTDATFEWPTVVVDAVVWNDALVFRDGEKECVVLFSDDRFLLQSVRRDVLLKVRPMEPPKGSDPELPRPSPFQVFFDEQFESQPAR
ncbi:MAG: hypothetical protein HYS13_13305 [Planctomycetia bacterium]|nr:hypothetical protein [Planctomycetia bacterium]